MDTDVHIRHELSLKIRCLRWLVSDQDVPEPLLGRALREDLGPDTKQILVAAADKYASSVDAEKLDITMGENGTSNVFSVIKGVYHMDEFGCLGEEEDTTTDWYDLGSETDKEWEGNLIAWLKDASNAGI